MKSIPKLKSENRPGRNQFLTNMSDRGMALAFLFFFLCTDLLSQPGLMLWVYAGKNNASEGLFLSSATVANYGFRHITAETGFQFNLKNCEPIVFSGFFINASAEKIYRNCTFRFQGFYRLSGRHELFAESNWGGMFAMRHMRFEAMTGTNFRTYAFRACTIKEFGLVKGGRKFHENFNLMYSLGYYIRKADETWNAGVVISNFDTFIIEQEVNPCLSLHGFFNPDNRISVHIEARYQFAGLFNLATDHFGLTFKTGISWNFM